jgi:hypothetical protein
VNITQQTRVLLRTSMFALVYLIVAMILGACICRRFYVFNSSLHYLAASFLVGLLVSTWMTYLLALPFASRGKPLLGANILFFAFAAITIYLLRAQFAPRFTNNRPGGSTKWDAAFLGGFFVLATYLMFGTVSITGGKVRLASVVWNDFGPNLSLVQSFALGHNFPTQYPHFIGAPIRYHFLFWFAAGNLEFLGLNLAWSVNLLSVLSLLAMLMLVMTLGESLFHSRAVGRIAASLFFFPSTLSYVPFLRSQPSFGRILGAIVHINHWLPSGYAYKGEDWGTWSLSIWYVQRHFLAGVGVLLMVLIFLVDFFQQKSLNNQPDGAKNQSDDGNSSAELESPQSAVSKDTGRLSDEQSSVSFKAFIFSGFLLGLIPLWNSPGFAAAVVLLIGVLLLLPYRAHVLRLLITAGIVGLPQVWFFFWRGHGSTDSSPFIHWGSVVENPTLTRVLGYFLFTFGPRLLLAVAALWFLTSFHRRLFGAALILPILAFTTQLSTDIINNHKFLYIWLFIVNLFVAFGLWRIGKAGAGGRALAIALALVVTLGGIIEWFRIRNDTTIDIPYRQNPLSDWLQANTRPTDVFLSDRFVIHPILLNGRRIFYGWPYFAWSLGYPTGERDAIYGRMFSEQAPNELVRLLNEHGVGYVAIDDGLRHGPYGNHLNEAIYGRYFKKVFEDKTHEFGSLIIYQVPSSINEAANSQ